MSVALYATNQFWHHYRQSFCHYIGYLDRKYLSYKLPYEEEIIFKVSMRKRTNPPYQPNQLLISLLRTEKAFSYNGKFCSAILFHLLSFRKIRPLNL